MKYHPLILATLTILVGTTFASRPNIVLIMTDDQGYGDLGATGNPLLKTPNIDAMAKRSGTARNFYVSPVCAPTRASLMTGRYNYRTRCIDTYIGRAMMDKSETTIAEILLGSGYATGIFGKWHLGDCYPMRAMDQGFQESLVLRGGGIGQPSDPEGAEGMYTNPVLFLNGKAEKFEGYCTDIYFNNAMDFISRSKAKEKPFFIYLPTNAPHGPFHDVPEKDYKDYKEMDLSNQRFPQERGHKLPPKHDQDQRARIFAMIQNIDTNVGRMFEHLRKEGIYEDTIVIFMVDNGPNGRRYVAGHKGMKTFVHEGGTRSPFFLHWPAKVKAGASTDRIAAHIDILPTLLAACGVGVPCGLNLDGRNILPLLTGDCQAAASWEDRMIVIQAHRGDQPMKFHNFYARTQDWKLLHASGFGKEGFTGEPKFELYNMKDDPLELDDVSAKAPAKVAEIKAAYEKWFEDVSSTRPDNYSPPRIHVGAPQEKVTTLTRQDWRHTKGRPWAQDSHGYWELYNAKAGGVYDVLIRFRPMEAKAEISLDVGGVSLSKVAGAGATAVEFKKVAFGKQGPLRLDCRIRAGETEKGPWQVDVVQPM
jgi:arylsulfatase A-like enzyme